MHLKHNVLNRPAVHFTPRKNWMNDPNGLVFYRGTYHLFFQHNPDSSDHDNMSWGHATSTDLVTWTEHPVAILYTAEEEIFSGSAVVDFTNSSGFGTLQNPPMVAIFTSALSDRDRQAQSLAYSTDDGMTWKRYENNPVLDRGSSNFRDPKVFRYSNGTEEYWVMAAVEAEDHQVLFYRSDDLKTWEFLSSYENAGAVGGVWECPDLFPLALDQDVEQIKWVLLISLNPGGVAGGSGTQYIVGNFDGCTFVPDNKPAPIESGNTKMRHLDWLDWGRDCYAGVTFNGLPGDQRTLIAWMSNWDYAHLVPASPWRGSMTVARRLSLRTIDGRPQLVSEPVLPEGHLVLSTEHLTLENHESRHFNLPDSARIELQFPQGQKFEIRFNSQLGETKLVFDRTENTLLLERSNSEYFEDDCFPSIEKALLPLIGNNDSLEIVLDFGSLEVFAVHGSRTITDQVFLGENPVMEIVSLGNRTVFSRMRITDLAQ